MSVGPCSGDDCAEILADLGRYLDGEVGADRIETIASHLLDCDPCGHRADFDRHLRELVRSRCVEHAPPELFDRVRQCLEDSAPAE